MLIRAVGPGLEPFGVSGLLAQPVVKLFAGAEGFVSNTGWNSAANASEIRATAARVGAFALAEGGRDSAILVSLSPGPYTIQVSGANKRAASRWSKYTKCRSYDIAVLERASHR